MYETKSVKLRRLFVESFTLFTADQHRRVSTGDEEDKPRKLAKEERAERLDQIKKELTILDLETLEERREILCIEFAKKCLKSDKMKQFFTKNSKIHPMETRNEERYDVDFAKTGRLQNSPIIYMQRLLNGL